MKGRRFGLGEGWVALVAGLAWLGSASDSGWIPYLLSVIPGSLLVATGLANGLWPGDARALQHGAIAAVLGVGIGLLSFAWAGFWGGIALVGLSAASFLAVGFQATRAVPEVDGVPAPVPSLSLAAEVAADEALLWMIVSTAERQERLPHGEEIEAAVGLFADRGWLEKPETYHAVPPSLEKVSIVPRRFRGIEYEHLSFESGFEPHAEEPGRERYLGYSPCRTAHAWALRHGQEDRPWLICIHGLGMGWPLADFTAFPPRTFHQGMGLNVLYPILPFHGPRRIARISGEGFFSRNVLDTVHAAAQAVWDLRRLVSWIRSQGGTTIGVYGLSLGGFSTAMLSSFEDGLACAIPGIPAGDLAWLIQQNTPPVMLREIEKAGLSVDQMATLLHVVSPLSVTPRVPKERRYLFAATADRIVPADPVHRLWLHWEEPKVLWLNAAHLSAPLHREAGSFLREALREAGLLAS